MLRPVSDGLRQGPRSVRNLVGCCLRSLCFRFGSQQNAGVFVTRQGWLRDRGNASRTRQQVPCRIKNLSATPASHPALRDFELVGHDFKHRAACRAARNKTHLALYCRGRRSQTAAEKEEFCGTLKLGAHQNPAVFPGMHREPAVGRIGCLQLVGLALQNTGEHEIAALIDMGTQQGSKHF